MSRNETLESRPSDHASLVASPVGSLLTHPDQLLDDPAASDPEKRAILADWASDARAVTDAPELRQLDSGAVVRVTDILQALRKLDDPGRPPVDWPSLQDHRADVAHPWVSNQLSFRRRKSFRNTTRLTAVARRDRPGDDDDPPSGPARAARPRPPRFLEAAPSPFQAGNRPPSSTVLATTRNESPPQQGAAKLAVGG